MPRIFVGGCCLGGCDDIAELHSEARLASTLDRALARFLRPSPAPPPRVPPTGASSLSVPASQVAAPQDRAEVEVSTHRFRNSAELRKRVEARAYRGGGWNGGHQGVLESNDRIASAQGLGSCDDERLKTAGLGAGVGNTASYVTVVHFFDFRGCGAGAGGDGILRALFRYCG